MTPVLCLLTFTVGALGWTLGEYLMHRFAMHELKGRGYASKEHLRHHGSADTVLESWFAAWAGVLVFSFLLLRPIGAFATGSAAAGWTMGAGWTLAYGFYDYLHWRAHRRPVANAYERRIRRHHFTHHFSTPMKNHGVTTAFWDKVFGTYVEPSVIRVPRRLAMRWLVDEDGEVRPEYAADYQLVGARKLDDAQATADLANAFANLAPAV